jgi:integrase
MKHFNYSLTPAEITNAKPKDKPYTLTDGGGLILEVLPTGHKVWRYKYHFGGKRPKVTIGPFPAIGLKAARNRHTEMLALVASGVSPADQKQEKAEEARQAKEVMTFSKFARVWIADTLFYRSEGYRAQRVAWLDNHVDPLIGDMPLGDVKPKHVLDVIEKRKAHPTTADSIRVMIQQIYNHAIRKLLVDTNPATPLRGVISVPPKTHYRHLSESELAKWWRLIPGQGAHITTIFATQLLLLTMARKGELVRSRWSEFDLDAAIWDVPAERMKMRRPHRVYLSTQAVSILRDVLKYTGTRGPDDYVFPSIYKANMPMGGETLNHFFGRIDFGVPEFCPHGTRGTAATLLRERGFSKDVVELLLAHAENDKTAAAYSHHELADERRKALQFLADHVETIAVNHSAAG